MRRLNLLLVAMPLALVAYGQNPVPPQRYLGPFGELKAESSKRNEAPHHEWEKLNTGSALDSFFSAIMSTYHVPGVAACIVKKDSVIWQGYYGYADLAKNKPVTDSTIFLLCSISKTIMVTALMQLYEQGKFQLDDSINAHLPFHVQNPMFPGIPITFRMLLTHTSSLQDNWNVMPYQPGDYPMAAGTYLQKYLTPGGEYYYPGLNFYPYAPGATWNYSNIGATLAGYLVETISGVPFDKYCRDSIFTPLEMSHTAWFLRDLDTALIARPYTYSGTYIDNGLYGFPYYSCGQLRTTVTSLARFLMANINDGELSGSRILESATVRMLRTVYVPSIFDGFSAGGLIWFREKYTGHDLWGHDGNFHGAGTSMCLSEVDSTGVIFLANTDLSFSWLSLMVNRLIDEAHALTGAAYAHDVAIDRRYARPHLDTVTVTARLTNPLNHTASLSAIVTYIGGASRDSVPMCDDGMHGDGQPDDSIWGCRIPAPSDEAFFTIRLRTDDLTYGNFWISDVVRFTTAGPVVVDSIITKRTSAEAIRADLWLKNAGKDSTVRYIVGKLRTTDPVVKSFVMNDKNYGDLGPGQRKMASYVFKVDTSVDSADIPFTVEVSSNNVFYWMPEITVHVPPVVIPGVMGSTSEIPTEYRLHQNYPNPFNPITTIKFELPQRSHVTLTVFNTLGQKVRTLVDEVVEAGYHEIQFDARDLSSGVYFYRLAADQFTATRRLVLIR